MQPLFYHENRNFHEKQRELQQIASNHSSDIDFKDFINIYKDYTKKPYSFLVIDFLWLIQLYHQIIHYYLGKTYYKLRILCKN